MSLPSSSILTHGQPHDETVEGMQCIDTSANPRIPLLMHLVGGMSRATDAGQVLDDFIALMRQAFGRREFLLLSTLNLPAGHFRITRWLGFHDQDKIATDDPLRGDPDTPVHTGGFFGSMIRSAYPEIIHHLRIENDPVFGDELRHCRSLMAVPVFIDGEPAAWAFVMEEQPTSLAEADLEQFILRANIIGVTCNAVQIAQQLREADSRIQREVDQIASIQRALLPEHMPRIDGLTLAASYATYDRAGGDYYDFIPLGRSDDAPPGDPRSPWGIFIADASGHGPAAAVVMAMLHAILHAFPHAPLGPAEVLEHTNAHLCKKRIEGSFVTAFFAVYDPRTRRLTYARAGHNPSLLKNPGEGGSVRRLDEIGGIPLGVMESITYEEATVTLQPGQSVVMYTDGITEAFGEDGSMFGMEGIENALTHCSGMPECVVESITTALRTHEGARKPSDDQTLVVLRLNDNP